jgi:CHAT domain-containing protein
MRFPRIVLLALFVFPLLSGSENVVDKKILEYQTFLMQKVRNFKNGHSQGDARECLNSIYLIYASMKEAPSLKTKTYQFYTALLDSSRYRKLYPHIYYYISKFHRAKNREKYLLKSLKFSQSLTDQQFILQRLYSHYNLDKIDYLAQLYLKKLIEVQKQNKDYVGVETSLIELALILKKQNEFIGALNVFYETLGYSKLIKASKKGSVYLEISDIFKTMNRYQLAGKYLDKAMENADLKKDFVLKIRALNAKSSLHLDQGDYAEALKLINLSLEVEQRLNEHVCCVNSLYKKALILSKHEDLPEGGGKKAIKSLLKVAVEKGLKLKKYENLLPIMAVYIQQLINDQEFDLCEHHLNIIDDIYAPYYSTYFFFYYLKAIFFEKKGNLNDANRYYQETIKALERYISESNGQLHFAYTGQVGEIYSKIIEFYLHLYNLTENRKYLLKAIYFSEVKNSYIYEFISLKNKSLIHLQEEKRKLEEEYIKLNKQYLTLLSKDSGKGKSAVLFDIESKLKILKSQNEELKEFILEVPIVLKRYNFKDFNTSLIQKKLGPEQIILKYTLLNDAAYIFYLDYRNIGYRKLDIPSDELINLIRYLTAPLDDFTQGNVDYLRINYDLQLAYKLFKRLLKDILDQHKDKKELFIIPDGELFRLPFEALVMGFNQREFDPNIIFSEYLAADFLIEKYITSYFLTLFHVQKKVETKGWKKFTVSAFGDPLISKLQIQSSNETKESFELFETLPSSRKEILNIRKIFGETDSQIFLRERFNRTNFEIYAPLSRVIHIATHFINNLHFPRYSALVFSSLDSQKPFSYFFAHELLKLKLNSDLVVLSACESSEKNLLGMQSLKGMTASFKNAGARSMIVSMWPVDEISSEIIPIFYQQYQSGEESATALQVAKLKLMKMTTTCENGQTMLFCHPFLWANYILINFSY